MDRARRELFEQYLQQQVSKAGAFTLGQKLDLVRRLRQQAHEGIIPVGPSTAARLTPSDPRVQAVLAGETVSVGSGQTTATGRGGLAEMSTLAKVGIMVGGAIVLIGLFWGITSFAGRRGKETVTPTVTVVSLPRVPTATPTPTVSATMAAVTASLTVTSPVALPVTLTPTPYALALGLDEAAEGGNAPASVELAGFTFVLGEGEVQDGVWQPTGAEWLAGTELRRVVAVPYSPDLANAVSRLHDEDTVALRLRSGEVVEYRVTQAARVKRHQIEALTERAPSIAVLLYGERAGERWVVVGEAVQRPEDFAVYTPVPMPATPTPTPVPLTTTQIITDAQVVTNTAAGLALHISPCNRVMRVGEQEPPRSSQQFIVCPVSLRAVRDGVMYSGQSLAVTEYDWITEAVDWWPQIVSVSDMLGDGVLNAGNEATGQVAGVVIKPAVGRRSEPVLVWEQAGIRYVIQLEQ